MRQHVGAVVGISGVRRTLVRRACAWRVAWGRQRVDLRLGRVGWGRLGVDLRLDNVGRAGKTILLLARRTRVRRDKLQNRQRERRRLARARLCGRDDVTAGKNQRNRLLLHGCWCGEAQGVNAPEDVLV